MTDFKEILEALIVFEDADEEEKWKRCLVCGVCMISKGIAVNTTQLRRLIFKCKSSINGSLKGLGFDKILTKSWAYEGLLAQVPYLRENPADLRQWTIRTCSRASLTNFPCGILESGPAISPRPPISDNSLFRGDESQYEKDCSDDLTDSMFDCPPE
jgi:hypothetical protein